MPLEPLGFVDLPPHVGTGGFDHAAVHEATGLVYVAHTANDAVDVFDIERRAYVGSIPGLKAVAGALVSESMLFTSNRGDNTVGIFTLAGHRNPGRRQDDPPSRGPDPRSRHVSPGSTHGDSGQALLYKAKTVLSTGTRPNGLAHGRERLLAAHVGDPAIPGSCTVSIIDVATRRRIADLAMPGRTRWTVFDPVADVFYVNIMEPAQIVVVRAGDPIEIVRVVAIPAGGPHGLDIDVKRRRLYCACDAGQLLELDADTGALLSTAALAGPPDVIFLHASRERLYVAIGDPGVIEAFATNPLAHAETVRTEAGAHTLAFDASRDLVCAFLPQSHRAAIYRDTGRAGQASRAT